MENEKPEEEDLRSHPNLEEHIRLNEKPLQEEDLRFHPNLEEYIRLKSVKKGFERLERRPATGYLGLPKKAGHGGKYTWEGPEDDGELEPAPPAIDERDPNFVPETEDVPDAEVVVGEVEVPKAPATPSGVARVELVVKPRSAEHS